MRIAFAGPGEAKLSGGMIMAILIGNAMVEHGYDACYLAERVPDEWAEVEIPHRAGSITEPADLAGLDAVITGFDGVRHALRAQVPVVAHFLAGYEPHLWPARREQFEAAYRLPTEKLAIAPHLQRTLREELGIESTMVGAPIELGPFRPGGPAAEEAGRPLRVLVVGPEPDGPFAPVPFKGIATALAIAERARDAGARFELVRLTPRDDPFSGDPRFDAEHVAVAPAGVPEIYRACDAYLGASTPAEGLGMPAIEAACSGLPLILPEIPSFLEIEALAPSALFYAAGDAAAGAERLARLASEPGLRERLRTGSRRSELIERFDPAGVAERTVEALECAFAARG